MGSPAEAELTADPLGSLNRGQSAAETVKKTTSRKSGFMPIRMK